MDTTLKVTGCTGSVAGGRNPVVVSISSGTGNAIIIGGAALPTGVQHRPDVPTATVW